jgi:hypothetical protein
MQYDRKTKTKTNRGEDREIKKDRERENGIISQHLTKILYNMFNI